MPIRTEFVQQKMFIRKTNSFQSEKKNRNCNSWTMFQNRGESSGTPGTRTSNVLPDLLSQASPATPPRHDKSSSEEVRFILLKTESLVLFFLSNSQLVHFFIN